jgi:hypothetical protein
MWHQPHSARFISMVAALWIGWGIAPPSGHAQAPAGVKSAGPELRLGKLDRPPGHSATIPVYFTAGQGKNPGSIRAELAIPEGAWVFQTAQTPQSSWWKVSSRDKGKEKPDEKSKASENARALVLMELSFTGGGRPLPEGLVAYLTFQVEPSGSPLPAGLGFRKIETSAPATGLSKPGAPGAPPTLSSEPPPTPIPSCFFFSH